MKVIDEKVNETSEGNRNDCDDSDDDDDDDDDDEGFGRSREVIDLEQVSVVSSTPGGTKKQKAILT